MVARRSKVDWQQGQDALRDEVSRVTALLRSIRDPEAPAVGHWNLAEVAVHLSQAWIVVPDLARRDLSRIHEVVPSLADVAAGDSLIRDLWDLGEVTTLGVRSDPERDPAVLADRIEAGAQEYFSECVGADPDAPRPWLVHGTTVRQSTLTYHLLNETVMHGYDIARAAGRRWRIEPVHAVMVLERFLVPVIRALDPRALVNGAKAAGLRATYDIRIRGGRPLPLRLRQRISPGRRTVLPSGGLSCLGRPGRVPHGGLGAAEPLDRDRHGQTHRLGPQTVAGTPVQSTDAQPLATRAAAYPAQGEAGFPTVGHAAPRHATGGYPTARRAGPFPVPRPIPGVGCPASGAPRRPAESRRSRHRAGRSRDREDAATG